MSRRLCAMFCGCLKTSSLMRCSTYCFPPASTFQVWLIRPLPKGCTTAPSNPYAASTCCSCSEGIIEGKNWFAVHPLSVGKIREGHGLISFFNRFLAQWCDGAPGSRVVHIHGRRYLSFNR